VWQKKRMNPEEKKKTPISPSGRKSGVKRGLQNNSKLFPRGGGSLPEKKKRGYTSANQRVKIPPKRAKTHYDWDQKRDGKKALWEVGGEAKSPFKKREHNQGVGGGTGLISG